MSCRNRNLLRREPENWMPLSTQKRSEPRNESNSIEQLWSHDFRVRYGPLDGQGRVARLPILNVAHASGVVRFEPIADWNWVAFGRRLMRARGLRLYVAWSTPPLSDRIQQAIPLAWEPLETARGG